MKTSKLVWAPLALVAVGLFIIGAPSSATAQEQSEEEGSLGGASPMRTLSYDIRREKRREAKKGGWATGATMMGQAGFDNNIYYSPEDVPGRGGLEKKSATGSAALELAVRRDFTKKDHFDATATVEYAGVTEDTDIDELSQSGKVRYRRDLTEAWKASVSAGIEHSNDSAVNIMGRKFTRDYESVVYRADVRTTYDLSKKQRVGITYGLKRKDYSETSGLTSLDWFKHEFGAQYRWRPSRDVTFKTSYKFKIQKYDEELANNVAGVELPGAPDENHRFHTVAASVNYDLMENLSVKGVYHYGTKDDRYQKFESYQEHGVDLGLTYTGVEKTVLRIKGYFDSRDYNHRPDATTARDLEFDRYGIAGVASYQLTTNLGLFGGYQYSARDSNRTTGISYLDYDRHSVLMGFVVAL